MGLLLADEASLAFPELVVPLLVATVAVVVLWLVLLLAAALATRPREVDAAAATMELGEESPAVVDLLTNEWRVTPDAVPLAYEWGRSSSSPLPGRSRHVD